MPTFERIQLWRLPLSFFDATLDDDSRFKMLAAVTSDPQGSGEVLERVAEAVVCRDRANRVGDRTRPPDSARSV